MNILFWTDGFWPRIGGIETQALQFIEGLHQKGHRCEVMAHKDLPHWKDEEIYRDIPIRRFDFKSVFPEQNLKPLRPIGEHLERILQEFKPDMIHLNTCFCWGALIFLLFRRRFRVPIVLTVHSPMFYMQERSPLFEKICLAAHQICCVSNWVLTEMQNLIPPCKDKLRLIYNGLPMPEIVPSALSFTPPVLLLIGRFTSEKGFKTAIAAFALLKHQAAKLMLVGDGEERPSLEQLVQEFNLRNSVSFVGAVSSSEVHSFIDKATLVVVPSYFESFGLVALEAMQMGRPVIASDVGGLKELVCHGETGLLVPPEDPTALAEAMNELLQQPELAKKMGAEGRKRAMEQFTLEQNVDKYETLYRELT